MPTTGSGDISRRPPESRISETGEVDRVATLGVLGQRVEGGMGRDRRRGPAGDVAGTEAPGDRHDLDGVARHSPRMRGDQVGDGFGRVGVDQQDAQRESVSGQALAAGGPLTHQDDIDREAQGHADEPAEIRHASQGRDDGAEHRHQGGGNDAVDRGAIVSAIVPVSSGRAHRVEVVHHDMLLPHDEEVGDQDAEERTDEGAEDVERVMDHGRVVVEVPRSDEDRGDGRDHPAHAPADMLRSHVREIEGRGDEVRHDVDADRRRHEGEGAEHHRVGVVDLTHRLHRIDDEVAEDRQGRRGGDDGEQARNR